MQFLNRTMDFSKYNTDRHRADRLDSFCQFCTKHSAKPADRSAASELLEDLKIQLHQYMLTISEDVVFQVKAEVKAECAKTREGFDQVAQSILAQCKANYQEVRKDLEQCSVQVEFGPVMQELRKIDSALSMRDTDLVEEMRALRANRGQAISAETLAEEHASSLHEFTVSKMEMLISDVASRLEELFQTPAPPQAARPQPEADADADVELSAAQLTKRGSPEGTSVASPAANTDPQDLQDRTRGILLKLNALGNSVAENHSAVMGEIQKIGGDMLSQRSQGGDLS
jgi:hypothetical protein